MTTMIGFTVAGTLLVFAPTVPQDPEVPPLPAFIPADSDTLAAHAWRPRRTRFPAIDVVHQIKDLHVTLLRLLGLDDNRLTYFHGGRYKQLSQTGGEVIEELIA